MIKQTFLNLAILLSVNSVSFAGTIANGVWSPSACGTEPVAPAIEQDSIDAYNKSVKAINDWQTKAQAFNECVINEANADNAIIAKTANDQQSRLHGILDKIKSDMVAAKAKLIKK